MRRGARDRDRDRRVRVRASRAIDRASIDRAIDRSIDGARSMARDLARARERHTCTRTFLQCLPFSLPPSSAASPPSRRPRSKCVFFSLRATRDDAGTRRAETRRRGTRWDARDGMGSRATGRGDAGRARGEATALGRRERAERNDLNRRRRAGGRARARDARDARDTRFVAVSVSYLYRAGIREGVGAES